MSVPAGATPRVAAVIAASWIAVALLGTLYGRSTFELDRVAIYAIARPQGAGAGGAAAAGNLYRLYAAFEAR